MMNVIKVFIAVWLILSVPFALLELGVLDSVDPNNWLGQNAPIYSSLDSTGMLGDVVFILLAIGGYGDMLAIVYGVYRILRR